jgi:hypothetical protein
MFQLIKIFFNFVFKLKYYMKKKEGIVNWGKIKRDGLIRETNLDSRFTTKVVKSKKVYDRKKIKGDSSSKEESPLISV